MLLSFVMALSVAALAPWVAHTSPDWVCTVSGPEQRMASADPAIDSLFQPAPPHLLDCVLCLALNMPPAWATPAVAPLQAFAAPQPWGRTAALPRLQTSQLGARGPPASV